MDFHSTHVFSIKKADNSTNFAAGRIQNRRTRDNSLQRQEQTLDNQLCDGLQGNKSCEATSHARALPHSYISCLEQMEVAFWIAHVLWI
jgi:hypothetical protein